MQNFLKSEKKSFKASKTNQIYILDSQPYMQFYPPPPFFFHTHTHTPFSTSQLYYFLYTFMPILYVCMYTYKHMKASSFF